MKPFSEKEKSPLDDISLADISKEAQKLHEEHSVDTLQEALHNDQAIKLLLGYVEKGKMTMDT